MTMNKAINLIFIVALTASFSVAALPPPQPSHIFHDLFIGEHNELVAAHTDGSYRSADDGEHWQRVLETRNVQRIIDTGKDGLLAIPYQEGGVGYHSKDFGLNWLPIEKSPVQYRCGLHKIEMTKDDGKTWGAVQSLAAVVPETVSGCRAAQLLIGPGRRYYFYNERESSSLYLSADEGATWRLQRLLDKAILPPGRNVETLFIDSRGSLYANTLFERKDREDSEWGKFERQMYRSRDRGLTWKRLNFGR